MRHLRQSTSVDLPIGPFLDSVDAITAETALTITQPDVRLKKNAAAWAQKAAAQTLSHEENGYYEVTLDATDTNTLGLLRLAVAESGALPIWEDFMVMPAAAWDALYSSTNSLQFLDQPISQVSSEVASVQADTNDMQTTLAALPAAVWAVATRSLTTFGTLVADVASAVSAILISALATYVAPGSWMVLGVVAGGSSTTSIITSSLTPTVTVADQFKGRIVIFDADTTTANLRGQGTTISANTSGGVLTVTTLTDAPVSGDTFVIV